MNQKTEVVRPVCRCGRGEVAVTVTEMRGDAKVRELRYCRECAANRGLVVPEHADTRRK